MQPTSSLPGVPAAWAATVKWLFVFGEPGVTSNDYGWAVAGLITWSKVIGLFALLASWLLSWVVSAYRTRDQGSRRDWLGHRRPGVRALLGLRPGSVVLLQRGSRPPAAGSRPRPSPATRSRRSSRWLAAW